MAIAISEEHRELARTTRAFLASNEARAANRALLESDRGRSERDNGSSALVEAPQVTAEPLPTFWKAFADLGLLGVHLPEEHGGGGAGLPELVVVVEELGRAAAPGPFVPTVAAAAVLAAAGDADQRARLLPGLAAGETTAAVGLGGELTLSESGTLSGDGGVVLGGALASLFALVVGDDVVVVPAGAPGLTVEVPRALDPARRSARLWFDGVVPAEVLPGARLAAQAVTRTVFAAEAVGGALEAVETATGYAKVREQFGRPIGTFQAVKHHLANMFVAAELATAAVWDAARAAQASGDEFALAAASAAALALPAFADNASLSIQVHGGIGYTWEHDAHLLLRRATTLVAVLSPDAAAAEVTRLGAAGVGRAATLDLPAEIEAQRAGIRAFAQEVAALPEKEQLERLIDTGYVQPHWPRPWGLEASAGLQLVIDQEFAAAGVKPPSYGITGWNILTLVQHGTADQIDRYVRKALTKEEVWCQLFSEPAAGSDAAGIRTRAEKVDGGWVVNGQKVWTSLAQYCQRGLATVRTDPAAPKHAGVTMMVIDMSHPGVDVRPLRQTTGDSGFNEVFLTDVFVPDADVLGEPNQGWKVARATLGNERVSIGGGVAGAFPSGDVLELYRTRGAAFPAAAERVGHHVAEGLALAQLNLRRAVRAVAGGEPGPEGNVTKLALAEHVGSQAALNLAFGGPDVAFLEGPGALAARSALAWRGMTIAGGTSEITRNQIAERILGLPRDPLLK
ncbi:acyl-CoA dehydrogenase [Frankia sp. CNm7]|uniref:Acyl-CoA dehydrogenase n=1 Tax=Frankia nepalensis TaxID=1836974 RepID=A0A937RFE1_9ACTN|nr:acyl-CoA dehydrogenase [Frankia nepalensis]MBL7495652.1 acyl-CoA dehydrogenase [Frankia nepalensis]MBL7510282.1 acyl-CoA dehydrogenase [Frankia nepalensis]MBL7520462.1 acyl-CoA dehydrogenase [Frankia nepalensis]MBL7631191.1 acyl-CoA dehydrogenase [Frankia nepalensis]